MVDRRAYFRALLAEGWAWLLATLVPTNYVVTGPSLVNRYGGIGLTLGWVVCVGWVCYFVYRADRLARKKVRADIAAQLMSAGRLKSSGDGWTSLNDLRG